MHSYIQHGIGHQCYRPVSWSVSWAATVVEASLAEIYAKFRKGIPSTINYYHLFDTVFVIRHRQGYARGPTTAARMARCSVYMARADLSQGLPTPGRIRG